MGKEEQIEEFALALCQYVERELDGQDGEYVQGAVRVTDARNLLFQTLPHQVTDEGADIYALADLCHVDEDMNTVADLHRTRAVAKNYF